MGYKFNPFTTRLDFYDTAEATATDSAKEIVFDAMLGENISALKVVYIDTDQDYQYKQYDQAINVTSTSVVTANADAFFHGKGVINVLTSGTLQLQFRSENGTAVTIRPDSIIKAVKVL